MANNYDLPFHTRVDIRLGSGPGVAYSSVRFGMPDMVVLRKGGLAGPKACDSTCAAACTLRFKLQAYHEQDNLISYGIATPNQMGMYKCLEHLSAAGTVMTDPILAPTTALSTFAARCPSSSRAPTAPPGLSVTYSGEVTFPVDTAGIWQVTIMATCVGCYGGNDGQAPVDFLIRVQDSASDPNPPVAGYNASVVPGLAPATSRAAPITVTCGRPGFTLGPGGPTAAAVRVAYYDPDDGLSFKCVSSPNAIASIAPANTFPSGVTLSALARVGSYGYLDIQWQPRCEDVSQVRRVGPRLPGPARPAGARGRAGAGRRRVGLCCCLCGPASGS